MIYISYGVNIMFVKCKDINVLLNDNGCANTSENK